MYAFRSALGPVDLAFTDRHGGVSGVPFDSLNLALVGHDDPVSTAANLSRVLADFAPDARVADMSQVHGAEVADASSVPGGDGGEPRRPECDALVTADPDVVLVVRAADCVPVLLADPVAGVVGAAHCGRPGLARGVVPATVARMRVRGAGRISAWIGPHVCGSCYEVPEDLRAEVPEDLRAEVGALVPASVATTSWGTPSLDLGAGVRAQLEAAGVPDVQSVDRCTRESPDLFSYRRDGADAGRLAGLIRRHAGREDRA